MISSSAWWHTEICMTIPLDAPLSPSGRAARSLSRPLMSLSPAPGCSPGPDSLNLARGQAAWLAAGTVPQVSGLDSDMVAMALLDLHVLSRPYGVPVAGWSNPWRYVWPRDSALVASALARTRHTADAERIVGFLQQVQPESGLFQARYLPDGSGVPDARGVELDGLGWALWATAQVAAELPKGRTAFGSGIGAC
jgi:hypothetical protein